MSKFSLKTTTLERIISAKKLELEKRKAELPLEEIISNLNKYTRRNFLDALRRKVSIGKPALIAEVKFASPSRGTIRDDLTPERVAEIYEKNSLVDCISVLTEKQYFKGDITYLDRVRRVTSKPILRKDFIIDEYQIYESVFYGADCILLIALCLEKEQLQDFMALSENLGISTLIEVYEEEDIEKIKDIKVEILGINSRNLKTLQVSLERSLELLSKVPTKSEIVVAESGIKSREDIVKAVNGGFNAFLIGEAFMSSNNIDTKINELLAEVDLPTK